MGYIQAYLKPGDRVLEVGAGTGRYSLTIAELGAAVTAVEPVKHNLEILRGKIAPGAGRYRSGGGRGEPFDAGKRLL